jgi:hypothetical protein
MERGEIHYRLSFIGVHQIDREEKTPTENEIAMIGSYSVVRNDNRSKPE